MKVPGLRPEPRRGTRRPPDPGASVFGVAQVPEPLMRGDKAFHVAPAIAVAGEGAAHRHHFQDAQKMLGDIQVIGVAGLMKRDQNLVG